MWCARREVSQRDAEASTDARPPKLGRVRDLNKGFGCTLGALAASNRRSSLCGSCLLCWCAGAAAEPEPCDAVSADDDEDSDPLD